MRSHFAPIPALARGEAAADLNRFRTFGPRIAANRPGNRNDNLGFRLSRAQVWTGRSARRMHDPIAIVLGITDVGENPMGPGVQVVGVDALANVRRWPALFGYADAP